MKINLLFLLLLSFIVYGAEVLELTKEGVSNDFSKGETLELRVVESSSLKIGNSREDSLEIHKFRALDIGDNFLNLSIDKKNSLKLEVAGTRRIDVDNDGTFDLSANLVNIRSKVAILLLKSLDENVKVLESKKEENTTQTVNETLPEKEETKEADIVEKELSIKLEQSYNYKFILLIVIAVIIFLLILFFIIKKFG